MMNPTRGIAATTAAVSLALGGMLAIGTPATASPAAPAAAHAAPLTNTAHLDFLLDTASPPAIAGHTTYRLAEEPELTMPWTYADARDGGTFERIGGGGPPDPVTGDYLQGAYNADDIARAAVVYLRHWRQTGSAASRESAYQQLRALAYFQTADGPNAGNVVLWMQPDGDLNPSAEPVELPDPSDSAESYWLARTLWAFGEGVEAFAAEDDAESVAFTGFLRARMDLAVAAVDRQVLDEYGVWDVSDGVKVPAWLITDGADATAEAVLGLAAYVRAAPDAAGARTALTELAAGIAAMGAGDTRRWPYGAVLQWTHSRSIWHAWGSQMPAALAAASTVLGDARLLKPAVADAGTFTPILLTAGGPDNAWLPTPIDRTQIAYGADSRLQSLLAVGDATGAAGFDALAAIQAAWFFGANASGDPVYDPATGVTFDGVAGDGTVNRNSGAESTIHGLLAMLALDAHPEVAARARAVATVDARDGLRVIEAEAAASTGGEVVTPESAWTGESQYSGGSALALDAGDRATIDLGTAAGARTVEPVLWREPTVRSTSVWSTGRLPIGVLSGAAGAQGVSEAPGSLLPSSLTLPLTSRASAVTVRALSTTTVDALIVRPTVSSLRYSGSGATQLFQSSALLPQRVSVGWAGARSRAVVYRADGTVRSQRAIAGTASITLASGDFAVVQR